jgi:hypothetical protein
MRIRFASASVTSTDQCTSEVQVRACNNGTLSDWTGTYTAATCLAVPLASCDGVAHGEQQMRVRYESASVPFGSGCKPEVQARLCQNGTWTAWSGTYAADQCIIQDAASCDGTPHGGQQTRAAYQASSVDYGTTCQSEVQLRVCLNGAWTAWSGTFAAPVCVVEGPASCGATPHGSTEALVRYGAASVTYPDLCQSEVQSRVCNNGTWSSWTGTFTATSCEVTGRPCDGTPHGGEQSRTLYAAPEVPVGSGCVGELQLRSCFNGVWGPWSGTYLYSACTERQALGSLAAVTTGQLFGCALTSTGTVYCWGDNEYGQLGTGAYRDTKLKANLVAGLTGVVSIDAGDKHTCAVLNDGTARCWGSYTLGVAGVSQAFSPIAVTGIADAKEVHCGYSACCTVHGDGSARCWGVVNGVFGETEPALLTDTGTVTSASVSLHSLCLLRGDGTIQCRGSNQGCTTCTPLQVDGITTAVAVTLPRAALDGFACATLAGGETRCWGGNAYGQLGDGSRIDSVTPVTVVGLAPATQAVGSPLLACARLGDGHVACWGGASAASGRPVAAPALVPTLTNATQLSTYPHFWDLGLTCARSSDGTARCWGYGYLGDGNAISNTDLPRIVVSP